MTTDLPLLSTFFPWPVAADWWRLVVHDPFGITFLDEIEACVGFYLCFPTCLVRWTLTQRMLNGLKGSQTGDDGFFLLWFMCFPDRPWWEPLKEGTGTVTTDS